MPEKTKKRRKRRILFNKIYKGVVLRKTMVGAFKFKTTADIKVSKRLIDQVIGQEDAVEVIKTAAAQRRHVLLIGIRSGVYQTERPGFGTKKT